ncbi:MAG: hypothetical protein KDB03_16305 [Planctomycetales bacterium]|nr:hypothetical protein [Planctomycetales bacterium]
MTSFYPAVSSRATTQLGIVRTLYQLHTDQNNINTLMEQLSTGHRISKASEDPAAAIRTFAARRQLSFREQTQANLTSADTMLSTSESTLSQAQDILNEMRGLVVESGNNLLSTEEIDANLERIKAGISKLFDLANSKFRDQYIFGGSKVNNSPLEFFGDTVRFVGNETNLDTIADYSTTLAANVTAEDAFGIRSERIVSNVDLDPSVASTTQLSILNRGDGVRTGAISFSDGVNSTEVDLASAYTLQDVVDAINASSLGPRTLKASLTTNGLRVEYLDGGSGQLRIGEVGSGSTAADLGIYNLESITSSPVVGADLNPVLTVRTKLSQLFGGTGLTAASSLQVTQGSKKYTISISGISTIEDFINRIHRSGAALKVDIDPTGRFLSVQNLESGSSLSIGENGGNLASRLGLRTMDTGTFLSDLNNGDGIEINENGDDLIFTRNDGTNLRIDLQGVQTISDVLDRINNNISNSNPATRITASLTNSGNGIVLSTPNGTQPLQLQNAGGSGAAWGLGLIPKGESEIVGTVSGSTTSIRGTDVGGVEVDGVFSTLIRLRDAIQSGSVETLPNLTASLDGDIQRMAMARGVVGARQQNIQNIKDLSSELQLTLKENESNEIDADLAQVISDLQSRQAALQASLQLMGTSLRQSLIDYL